MDTRTSLLINSVLPDARADMKPTTAQKSTVEPHPPKLQPLIVQPTITTCMNQETIVKPFITLL